MKRFFVYKYFFFHTYETISQKEFKKKASSTLRDWEAFIISLQLLFFECHKHQKFPFSIFTQKNLFLSSFYSDFTTEAESISVNNDQHFPHELNNFSKLFCN
jgi:hypothetical protein